MADVSQSDLCTDFSGSTNRKVWDSLHHGYRLLMSQVFSSISESMSSQQSVTHCRSRVAFRVLNYVADSR